MVTAVKPAAANRGFSLVEMMVVIAIMGIVMAFAVPAIRDLLANQRMKSASFNLVVTAMYARSEAVKRYLPVNVVAASSNNLTNGWCVTVGSTCSLTAPDSSTMKLQQPQSGVTYTFFTTAGPIAFNRSGRLGSVVKVQIADAEMPTLQRCVTIDVSGSARAVVGACS